MTRQQFKMHTSLSRGACDHQCLVRRWPVPEASSHSPFLRACCASSSMGKPLNKPYAESNMKMTAIISMNCARAVNFTHKSESAR